MDMDQYYLLYSYLGIVFQILPLFSFPPPPRALEAAEPPGAAGRKHSFETGSVDHNAAHELHPCCDLFFMLHPSWLDSLSLYIYIYIYMYIYVYIYIIVIYIYVYIYYYIYIII